MKLTSIKRTTEAPVWDIGVKDAHHFILENGIVAHNSMYPKAIVSGGTGVYLSADNIYILGRQQEKEGTEIVGYNFIINVEKSRYVKEKSKIPVSVSFDGGISRWSGLLDLALESGHVVKPSNGWYQRVDKETGEIGEKKYRIKDTDNKDFWMPIVTSKSFNEFVRNKYQIAHGDIIKDEDIQSEMNKFLEDGDE